jgi:hypothetical protein
MLEIVLVVGSLVAGGALGIAALASEPVGGPRSAGTPAPGGGPLVAPGAIFDCLRTRPGLSAVAPDPAQPEGGEVFQFRLEDDSVVHVFLFPTEAAAQAYEAERLEGGPGQGELLLYRNAVVFAIDGITEDLRAALIGCVDDIRAFAAGTGKQG